MKQKLDKNWTELGQNLDNKRCAPLLNWKKKKMRIRLAEICAKVSPCYIGDTALERYCRGRTVREEGFVVANVRVNTCTITLLRVASIYIHVRRVSFLLIPDYLTAELDESGQ
jgi:hypothetical protein